MLAVNFRGEPAIDRATGTVAPTWCFLCGGRAPCAAIAACGNMRLPPVRGLNRRPRNAPLGVDPAIEGDRDGRPYMVAMLAGAQCTPLLPGARATGTR